MNKLELLGALFAKSVISEHRIPELAEMIDAAKEEISDEIDEAQHELWMKFGAPDFEVLARPSAVSTNVSAQKE